jgi:excisionase family DNA binding protein
VTDVEYWVVRDVAKLLKLSEKSIYRIVEEQPDFPHLRIGRGTLRFPKDQLLSWLARRTQGHRVGIPLSDDFDT